MTSLALPAPLPGQPHFAYRDGELFAGNVRLADLARAERQVEDGDLDHALRTLDRLPTGARDVIGGWRSRAERRAEIDRNAAALRARALRALAGAQGPTAAPAGEKVGT